jgi:DUF3096 family protein
MNLTYQTIVTEHEKSAAAEAWTTETRTGTARCGRSPTTMPNDLNNRPRYAKGQVTLLIVAAILVVLLSMVLHLLWSSGLFHYFDLLSSQPVRYDPALQEIVMALTPAHISPIIALIAGILILIMPRLLNFIVAIYLILIGLMGLNGIYHFIRL